MRPNRPSTCAAAVGINDGYSINFRVEGSAPASLASYNKDNPMIEIEDLSTFERLAAADELAGVVIQGLDLRAKTEVLMTAKLDGSVFLGCRLAPEVVHVAIDSGALVFPRIPDLPYHPYRPALYTVDDLYEGFDPSTPSSYASTFDARVYAHWRSTGGIQPPSIIETLARRLHDHAMTDALEELIKGRKVVAVMGGHSLPRNSSTYRHVAWLGRRLAREGFLMTTGGGPGAMEATHVGAYFASRADDSLETALDMLAAAPEYTHPDWLSTAFRVRQRFAPTGDTPTNLGIPTWHYGHEPPNPFASHIAKYFANSVREDGLLTIATAGVIFSPGSAGTIQEILSGCLPEPLRDYWRGQSDGLFRRRLLDQRQTGISAATAPREGQGVRSPLVHH